MKCKAVERLLSEDLGAASRPDVKHHLRLCAGCREVCRDLLSLQKLSRLLDGKVEAPASFSSRIQAATSVSRAGWMAWKPALLVMMLAVLLGAMVFWTEEQGAETRSSAVEAHLLREGKDRSGLPAVEQQPAVPYVEIILNQAARPPRLLRLPSTIEIRETQLHQDVYLHEVSH